MISGSPVGAFAKTGSGTLILTSANTYVPLGGMTTLSAGTLQIGDGGNTGSIATGVANSGALVFNRSDTLTYAGAISGTGSLTQAGAGTLALTGAATHTGGTTISAGTLQIGAGGTIGSIAGNISNSSALAFNRSDNITYGGVVSGSGSMTKAGGGTLTLTGANTYTGGINVDSGTLRWGVNHAISNSSVVTVASGATLDINNFLDGVGALAGSGNVTLGDGDFVFGHADVSSSFAGSITGSGFIQKVGDGTMTVSGDSTVTGGFEVNEGAMLQTGGTNTFNSLRTAVGAGTAGNYTLNSGVLSVLMPSAATNAMVVGFNGTSTFTQNNGAVEVGGTNGNLIIGSGTGSVGIYNLNNGMLTADSLYIGRDGGSQGTLNMADGMLVVDSDFLDLGLAVGATGTFNASGGVVQADFGIMVGGISTQPRGKGVLTVNGGAVGTPTLRVWNTTGSVINLQSGSITTGVLDTSSNPSRFNWTGGLLSITGAGGLTISASGPLGATPTIPSAGALNVSQTLTVAAGATLTYAAGSPNAVRAQNVNVPGKLDLKDNDLIVTGSSVIGTWNGSNYSGVTGLIRSGRNGGSWDGAGILTMTAASAASQLTTLGIALAGDAGLTSLGGFTLSPTNTLVIYAYAGDADLSGFLDGDDFAAIDAGYSGSLTGWVNGDFDYSGSVDADDYWLIDRNYSRDLPDLSPGMVVGVTSVPEPVTVLWALPLALMRHRRRVAML